MSKRQSKKSKTLAVRVPEWLADAIEEEAQQTSNPASYVVRAVLTKEYSDVRDEYENVDDEDRE